MPDRPAGVRVGTLDRSLRPRLRQILERAAVFRGDEVAVALELFDEAFPRAGMGTAGTGEAGMDEAGSVGPRADAVPRPAGDTPGSTHPGRTRPGSTRPGFTSPGSSLPTDYVFLGAFTPDDELVGYACYGPTPGTDRTYDLYWIVVDPTAQGAGSGTTLLHEVERRLEGLHARMLVVETSSRSDYAAAQGFYARRGYAVAARVRGFYAPGDDRIILTKRFQRERQQ